MNPRTRDTRIPFGRGMTFSRQFLLFGLLVLVIGMLTIGLWVQHEINRVFIARTAATTALYVESFVSHHVQSLETRSELDAADSVALDEHLRETPMGTGLVAVKLWTRQGTIAYSTNKDLVGLTYPLSEDLNLALSGEVISRISDLSGPQHERERVMADKLLETYTPIFLVGTEEPIAVAEFYQRPDALLNDIRNAQIRGWLIIATATLVMYLTLFGLARRATNLIRSQRQELEGNVARLSGLLGQNRKLQRRMQGAAGRVTALNEEYLHRISADLHDGPAQNIALAMLRLEALENGERPRSGDLATINSALDSALAEVRSIAKGLRLPEVDTISAVDTARSIVRSFERTTQTDVALQINDLPDDIPLSAKITVYRVLQEALANSFKHAPGASRRVEIAAGDHMLTLEVEDNGPGFDSEQRPRPGSLGLIGMRERVEMLGGEFELMTAPDEGTRIRIRLPLEETTDA